MGFKGLVYVVRRALSLQNSESAVHTAVPARGPTASNGHSLTECWQSLVLHSVHKVRGREYCSGGSDFDWSH